MSTSLLYHAFGIRGYHHTRTDYQGGQTIFTIRQEPETCRCPACAPRAPHPPRPPPQGAPPVSPPPREPEPCRCPACGSPKVVSRGQVERRFRTMPIGPRATFVVLPIPRVECRACGVVRQVAV